LHLLPLFQQGTDKLYHHGYPWECPEARRNVVYKPGDLPVAEETYAKLLSLPTFTDPAKDLIDQYIAGFQKVAANAAAIRKALSSQQAAGAR
jgi:dTDP-4-amino-4,6-dideoxygalactose transaminase